MWTRWEEFSEKWHLVIDPFCRNKAGSELSCYLTQQFKNKQEETTQQDINTVKIKIKNYSSEKSSAV